MTCPSTGKITRIFDLECVSCVELSQDLKEVWVILKSGHKFRAGESNAHSESSPESTMNNFADAFKELSGG